MLLWPVNKTTKAQTSNSWEISKSIIFCYGHRVWSQQLDSEYCATGDEQCKCRFLHGHQAEVILSATCTELENGMVTDFKHFGWIKDFLDQQVDHKFIMDMNDPWIANIINAKPLILMDEDGTTQVLTALSVSQPLNTTDGRKLTASPVIIPGTEHVAGFTIDVEKLSGPEREFYEGFFFVDFTPTSENLCKWLFECVDDKMNKINARISKVVWCETPTSKAVYVRENSKN